MNRTPKNQSKSTKADINARLAAARVYEQIGYRKLAKKIRADVADWFFANSEETK